LAFETTNKKLIKMLKDEKFRPFYYMNEREVSVELDEADRLGPLSIAIAGNELINNGGRLKGVIFQANENGCRGNPKCTEQCRKSYKIQFDGKSIELDHFGWKRESESLISRVICGRSYFIGLRDNAWKMWHS